MIPYLLYIFMTLILAIVYDKREDCRAKRRWYRITCLFLILLAGLRNGVGGDTLSYMAEYEDAWDSFGNIKEFISDSLINHGRMPLWSMILTTCRHFFESFYIFQLLHAILLNVTFFYVFKKFSKHIFLCALVYGLTGYFFLFNTEVLRESVAIVCSIVATLYFVKHNYIGYVVFAICGILCHASTAIIMIFPLMRFIPIHYLTLLACLLISFAIWAISDTIVSHLPSFIVMGDSSLAQKVVHYSDIKSNIFGFLEDALEYICFPYFIMYYVYTKMEDDPHREEKPQFIAFVLTIGVISASINGFARIRNYGAIFYIIALADFIYLYVHQPKFLFLTRTMVLAGTIYFFSKFYLAYYPYSNRYHYEFYCPYTSIFDNEYQYEYRYEMHSESTVINKNNNTRSN